ncbi:MAG TPA: MoaD/ThiS family protein [Longimicrobiales bacterium]|nr:MoaD/ThiS family protein [Longimicrobiales bacterium]
MLRVRILLFAAYRDWAGTGEVTLDVAAGASVGAAIRALRGHGDLWRLPEKPIVAVNREYADLDTRLRDGDEVAILPPVAGG